MKKLILLPILFLSIIGYSETIFVTDYSNLVIKDNNVYILNLSTDKGFPTVPGKTYSNVTIMGKLYYTGNAKAISIRGINLLFEDLDVEATRSASVSIEFWYSKNTVFNRVNAHGGSWGIRGFNDTNTIFKNCAVYDTWDDGIYIEDSRNTEVGFSLFKNNNYSYWEEKIGGGDCIQIAGDQGYVYIHHNYFDKVQNGGKFNVIIGETFKTTNGVIHTPLDDSARIEYNIFNARPHQLTQLEDTAGGHVIYGSSCLYLKPTNNCIVAYNDFYGGSNAIFTYALKGNNFNLLITGNKLTNQTEAICFGSGWDIIVNGNIFRDGLLTYLKYDGTNDIITKNIFYGLSNPKAGLYNNYIFTDNLINPEFIPDEYIANVNTTTITIYDTIPVHDTITHIITTYNTIVFHDTVTHIKDVYNVKTITDTVNLARELKNYLEIVQPEPLKFMIRTYE